MYALRRYSMSRVCALPGPISSACCELEVRRRFSKSTTLESISSGDENQLANLDSTKLTITKTFTPKPLISPDKLEFGRSFTDHILSIEWTTTGGWLPPRISPYQGLVLDPAAAVLQYAFTCFEGMKAYKDGQGRARLFRPDRNLRRLNSSAARIALPTFDEGAMLKLLTEYVRLESRWIPDGRGPSLYLRPTMIATDASISVSRPRSALLYLIAMPMSSYFKGEKGGSMKAVSLKATSSPVRAWPGGVGDKKLGGNYSPSIVPQEAATLEGFQQNLWLLGDPQTPEDQFVTEAGTMNVFVVWTSPLNGKRELVTPPLDGVILPGITRDSILELARERLEPRGWVVSERPIHMIDIQRASKQGHLLEMFGAGTAAVVSPIRSVYWQGEKIDCGLKDSEDVGPLTRLMKDWIEDIQYGVEDHPWSIIL